MSKTCRKCGLPKHPENDFHRNGEGGRCARCKSCIHAEKQLRKQRRSHEDTSRKSWSTLGIQDLNNLVLPEGLPPIQDINSVKLNSLDDLDLVCIDDYEEVGAMMLRRWGAVDKSARETSRCE